MEDFENASKDFNSYKCSKCASSYCATTNTVVCKNCGNRLFYKEKNSKPYYVTAK